MNRLMKCVVATAAMGIGLGFGGSSVLAEHEPGDTDEHGPYVDNQPPVPQVDPPVTTQPPVLTVPPVTGSGLPKTGTDSFDLVTIGGVASATGLGLVVVARSRRRRAPATA